MAYLSATIGTSARPASACSEPEPAPGYTSLTGSAPADGATDVPLDVALAIELQTYDGPGGTPTVSLVDTVSGVEVEGTTTTVYWDRQLVRFEPSALLEPNHAYKLVAQVTSEGARPDDALGEEQLEAIFTTGDATTAPLEVVGALAVELERIERDDYSTCDGGECTCEPTDTLWDTVAQLKVPAALGGHVDRPYSVLVMVTADVPYDFSAEPGSAHVYGNAGVMVQHESGVETAVGQLGGEAEYRPCFSTQIRDYYGNTIAAEPVCLDETVAPTSKDPPTEVGSAPDPVQEPETGAAGTGTGNGIEPGTEETPDVVDGGTETGETGTGTEVDGTSEPDPSSKGGDIDRPVTKGVDTDPATGEAAAGCTLSRSPGGTSQSWLLVPLGLALAALRRRRAA